MSYRRVLLASHDTEGARAAEQFVFDHCKPRHVVHLTVVPEFWRGMVGHDWLNNKAVSVDFSQYLSNQLQEDIQEHSKRLQETAETHGITYETKVMMGSPAECLLHSMDQHPVDAVVLGSPRPKGHSGLRSKMLHKQIIAKSKVPLIIVPHPLRK